MDIPAPPKSKRPLDDGAPSQAKRVKTDEEPVGAAETSGQSSKGAKGDKGVGKKKRANVGPWENRRDRRGTRGTRGDTSVEVAEGEEGEKKLRLPKRQCAVLLGFCGTGCNGMQIQPNARTIEGVLFEAMVKVGAVSADNADDPVKVGLKRAARTDAGVHAAGNVISIKMITSVPGVPDLVARINEELPPEIRLWSFIRAQNSFSAHTSCDSRMYTYFLPSYILIPPKPDSGLMKAFNADSDCSGETRDATVDPFWSAEKYEGTVEDDLRRKRLWRVDADRLAALRLAAAKYLGTHNFHNFTVGRDFGDRSSNRFIKNIEVKDPAVYGETEWIAVLFHGQSFMLHQRKMVCALVLTCRTGTPPNILEEMFGSRKVVVPKAPALGLLLEQPLFEGYNRKVAEANAKLDSEDPSFRPSIHFEAHRATIEQFKQDQIYSRMRAQEDKDAVYDAWIRSIDAYSGKDFLYLNSKGTIPPAAVIKRGEHRPNPFRERKRFDASGPSNTEAVRSDEEEDEEQVDKETLKDMEG